MASTDSNHARIGRDNTIVSDIASGEMEHTAQYDMHHESLTAQCLAGTICRSGPCLGRIILAPSASACMHHVGATLPRFVSLLILNAYSEVDCILL